LNSLQCSQKKLNPVDFGLLGVFCDNTYLKDLVIVLLKFWANYLQLNSVLDRLVTESASKEHVSQKTEIYENIRFSSNQLPMILNICMILIKSLKDSYRFIIVIINKKCVISNFVLLVLIPTSCGLRNDDRQGSVLVHLKKPLLPIGFLVLT